MQQTFYNTTRLSGDTLEQALINATAQEEAILILYRYSRKKLTPWDVHGYMTERGKRWPITSCRRAITNLMQKGELIKTSETKAGEYGAQETYYVINHVKYEAPVTVKQPELFA